MDNDFIPASPTSTKIWSKKRLKIITRRRTKRQMKLKTMNDSLTSKAFLPKLKNQVDSADCLAILMESSNELKAKSPELSTTNHLLPILPTAAHCSEPKTMELSSTEITQINNLSSRPNRLLSSTPNKLQSSEQTILNWINISPQPSTTKCVPTGLADTVASIPVPNLLSAIKTQCDNLTSPITFEKISKNYFLAYSVHNQYWENYYKEKDELARKPLPPKTSVPATAEELYLKENFMRLFYEHINLKNNPSSLKQFSIPAIPSAIATQAFVSSKIWPSQQIIEDEQDFIAFCDKQMVSSVTLKRKSSVDSLSDSPSKKLSKSLIDNESKVAVFDDNFDLNTSQNVLDNLHNLSFHYSQNEWLDKNSWSSVEHEEMVDYDHESANEFFLGFTEDEVECSKSLLSHFQEAVNLLIKGK